MIMHDWNVVVTVREEGYNLARRLLGRFGQVDRTDFYNILVMRVTDPRLLLEGLIEEAGRKPESVASLARVLPVDQTFTFQSPEEFDEKARLAVCAWLPTLAGKGFHLRMHRRGFKGKLSSIDEERFLDTYLLEALETAGTPGRITFTDPDAIIALETIGSRAGLSLWTREDLARYPLLHLD
jgi:tRNA(Ser,Leu) C12 N-acetylase TAN1